MGLHVLHGSKNKPNIGYPVLYYQYTLICTLYNAIYTQMVKGSQKTKKIKYWDSASGTSEPEQLQEPGQLIQVSQQHCAFSIYNNTVADFNKEE